ncbi:MULTISPECIES: alpha/beta hydrolase [Streptomyces]|uniref:Alpha/beta hydrolase n=1 Tax=Streptomyces cyaneofuscatus TaxID=66883 RepID=A0ABZ1F752_9ACTN|nr:alpha/beta hydrolase [Streptomyces cyaneofuscatus]WSB12264.1 alpha/beta hydrolase [Streptomyces cyaneofuscatus]WSD51046.1 alpha/beta hydrolase [Streptomyces cyaneofuscatus]
MGPAQHGTGPDAVAPTHSQGEPGIARTRDGRELYYQRLAGPANVPTVVFEGGLAAGRSYWAPVQAALADVAPTVVYDRSGLGRSPAAPAGLSRRLPALADDLGDLLDHLDGLGGPEGLGGPGRPAGPYVLVGHSWGGPLVRLAAAARPARVAGLVLVDPSDEACELLFRPAMRRAERVGQLATVLMARLGLLGRAYRSLTAALPPDAAADMRAEGYTVAMTRTRGRELEDAAGDLRALLESPPGLAGLPVTVVSAGRVSPGMPKAVRERATVSHAYRARQSPHGRHVVLREADHMVLTTSAAELAQEIRRLVLRGR